MPMSPRDLETAISRKLGFTQSRAHKSHRWFSLELPGHPTISTMVSHAKKDIGKSLESTIARQMLIQASLLREIVGCTKSRDEYIAAVRRR